MAIADIIRRATGVAFETVKDLQESFTFFQVGLPSDGATYDYKKGERASVRTSFVLKGIRSSVPKESIDGGFAETNDILLLVETSDNSALVKINDEAQDMGASPISFIVVSLNQDPAKATTQIVLRRRA